MLGLGLDIPTVTLRNELIEGIPVAYTNESGTGYTNEAANKNYTTEG